MCDMLTAEEEKAIRKLENVAKIWPESLALFSANGSLLVVKQHSEHPEDEQGRVVASILGIENDGGDPDLKDWNDE